MNKCFIAGTEVELPQLFNAIAVGNFFASLVAVENKDPYLKAVHQLHKTAVLLDMQKYITDLAFVIEHADHLNKSHILLTNADSLHAVRNEIRDEFRAEYGSSLLSYLDVFVTSLHDKSS